MQCLGRTKNRSRCRNEGSYFFCGYHKWQPAAFVFSLVAFAGLLGGVYQDILKPVLEDALGPEKQKSISDNVAEKNLQHSYQEILAEVNRPIVELESIKIEYALRRSEGRARFFLKNIGNMAARNICITIWQPFDTNGKAMFSDNELLSTCDGEHPLPSIGLRQKGETSFPLLDLGEINSRIGFFPDSAIVHRDQPHRNIFLFNIAYEDSTGTEYIDMFPFEFFEDERPYN